jgi:hypothetical protein
MAFRKTGPSNSLVGISYGLKGSADISGIFTHPQGHGLRLEIEVKTGKAIQSKEQLRFEEMILSRGGIYLLVHSADEAVDFCQEAYNNFSSL